MRGKWKKKLSEQQKIKRLLQQNETVEYDKNNKDKKEKCDERS